MHIIHLTSEAAPFAKVGGLADVVTGLSLEMAKKGHQLEILLPKYDCINYSTLKNLKVASDPFLVEENGQNYKSTIWSADYNGLKILLLETEHPFAYFTRKQIYGAQDDNDRFLYFCKAAVTYLAKLKKQPDVIHLHDWPTAIIPILYKELGLAQTKMVFTIHNLEYQGRCSLFNLFKIGLKKESYFREMQDPIFPGVINLLKGAIKQADALTTVSPTYGKEIKTQEGGGGLHPLLIENQHKLTGILNGIDTEFWNPEKDPFLKTHYSMKDVVEEKKENRHHLEKQLKLPKSKTPLVVSISRLVPQKGPQLIEYALRRTLEKGGQFVLLGNSTLKEMIDHFQNLRNQLAKNKNVSIHLEYNEPLSHLVFAAADMIVIPSIYEPCGLTQMIAMHYGTIPLARRTGGLADTVFDIDTSLEPENRRNGYTFDYPDTKGIDWVLDRAFSCHQDDPKKWKKIMQSGMQTDVSWKHSADEYLKIY